MNTKHLLVATFLICLAFGLGRLSARYGQLPPVDPLKVQTIRLRHPDPREKGGWLAVTVDVYDLAAPGHTRKDLKGNHPGHWSVTLVGVAEESQDVTYWADEVPIK